MALQPKYEELQERIRALEKEILELNRREEACVEGMDTYMDLFDKASDLIQSVSPEGRFIQVNRSWQETLGYAENELAGLTIWDIIHPSSRTHCEEILNRVLSGETVEHIEVLFLSKNGTPVPVEGSINCRFEGGKPVATRGFFRDITKRKLAEQRLLKAHSQIKDANRKLQLAYAKMREWKDELSMQLTEDEIGFLVDGEGRILAITDLALDSLGLNRMDGLRMNFLDLMEEADRKKLEEEFRKGLQGISEKIAFRLKVGEMETRPFEGKLLRMSAAREKNLLILLRETR